MGLPKGRTNNPFGRPKGSINQSTVNIRKKILNYFENNIEDTLKALKELEPTAHLNYTVKLLKFAIPAVITEIDTEEIEEEIYEANIVKLTDEELTEMTAEELVREDFNKINIHKLPKEKQTQYRILRIHAWNHIHPSDKEEWTQAILNNDWQLQRDFCSTYKFKTLPEYPSGFM